MEAPIHAANEVDKGEGATKVVAGIAGLVIIVLAVLAFAYFSGFWAPPPTMMTQAGHQTTQQAK